jgi:hypothetical protein
MAEQRLNQEPNDDELRKLLKARYNEALTGVGGVSPKS